MSGSVSSEHDESVSKEKFVLQKKLGFWGSTSIICGLMIGSGIFISPVGVVTGMHGSVGWTLIIWAVSGFVSGLAALCYAELGCCIRESGADFAYHNAAIGPVAAFLFVWTLMIMIRGAATAASTMIFGYYFLQLFSSGCSPPSIAVKFMAAFLILTATWINYRSVKAVAKIQIVFTAAKFFVLAVIIVAGVVWMIQEQEVASENFGNAFHSRITSKITMKDAILSFFQCSFSYSGFSAINAVTEEIRDVKKNLVRAIVFSVLIVTCFYIAVNLSYFCVLSIEDMLSSNALAVSFAEYALGQFAWIVPVGVCISIFGAANGGVMVATRITFVAARHEQMPDILSMIHTEYYTPAPALVLGAFSGLVMLCISESVMTLLNAFGFAVWLFNGVVALDLLILRRKYPELHRPFRVPLIIPVSIVLLSVVMTVIPLIYVQNAVFLYAAAFILAGLPVYYIFVYKKFTIPGLRTLTRFLQKLLNVAPTDWEEIKW